MSGFNLLLFEGLCPISKSIDFLVLRQSLNFVAERYGVYTLLFTWVPGIGDAITMVAGLMQLSFRYFFILVFLGKFGRYFAIAYLAVFFKS
jgi:membrane protein YqaA with SNARE-associated domain